MLRLRSVSSIVIAPASTGKDKSNKIAVIKTDHTNNGIRSKYIASARIFKIVEIKLIAPKIDLAPARWSEKMARSTAPPGCPVLDLRGG